MKYQKTVNLWAPGILEDILAGKLKLQRGQWCICGSNDKRCRYVAHNGRVIDVVHWQGNSQRTSEAFKLRVQSERINADYARQGLHAIVIDRSQRSYHPSHS